MIDLASTLAEPWVLNAVLAALTILAGWASFIYQRVTGRTKDVIAKETIHSAAETITKVFLDTLELAVRNGTPIGKLDGFITSGLTYIKGEGAGDSVKRLQASDATLQKILVGAAKEKMLEIKGKVELDRALAAAIAKQGA